MSVGIFEGAVMGEMRAPSIEQLDNRLVAFGQLAAKPLADSLQAGATFALAGRKAPLAGVVSARVGGASR